MKADIKFTIIVLFLNDDGEEQEEFFSHYLYGVYLPVDPSDLHEGNYKVVLEDEVVDQIDDLVDAEYENEEFPAIEHRLEFEARLI